MRIMLEIIGNSLEAGSRKRFETKTEVRDKLQVFLGFTLVESLVVFAVIGILSGIMFSSFRSKNQSVQLDFDADTFLGALYEARTLALAGQRSGGSRPNGGYGIQIASCVTPPCSYILFADTYPALPTASDHTYTESGGVPLDTVVRTFKTSKEIQVSAVVPSSPAVITFGIPNGTIYINGAQTSSELLVTFQSLVSATDRAIRVNRQTGRMNFE